MENIIEKINEIDHLYAHAGSDEVDKMLQYVSGPVERSYFIRKLSGEFNPYWFKFAYARELISFQDIPGPIRQEGEDNNISYGFKNWEGAFPILEAARKWHEYPDLLETLISIIDSYIGIVEKYKDNPNRNFTPDYYICRAILLLPKQRIDERRLLFVADIGLARDRSTLSREITGIFFNRILPEDHQIAFNLLDLFFTPVSTNSRFKTHGRIDDYALENFSKSEPQFLYKYLGTSAVDWAINKLGEVSKSEPFSFSKFELTSLEPDTQNSNESGFNFSIVRLVTSLLICLDTGRLLVEVERLIDNEHKILRRIAYFLIDRKYKELNAVFWKHENPLNEREAKLEIYRLINRNCADFKDDEVRQIVDWINKLYVEKVETEDDLEYQRHKAYRQLEWYMALAPIHYRFQNLLITPYNELCEITEGKLPPHPGYDSYFTITSGGDYSPTNRILEKPAVDVLNILANPQKWQGYNIYGLQQDVRDYVVDSYTEIAGHLNKFEAMPIAFIYNFMDGLRSIAEKSGELSVNNIFAFLSSFITQRDDLWDFSDEDREKSSSIGMIAWLIKTIVRNDDYQLPQKEIKFAIGILIAMEKRFTPEFEWLNSDPVNDIMNSTRGKIYDALITCSMREVKIQPENPFWDSEAELFFSERLHSGIAGSEFYWTVGFNIPQISYLSINWLTENKQKLFAYRDDRFDIPVFYGYVLFSGQLYTNLFEMFFDTYYDQVTVLQDSSAITRRFMEHIWVAYAIELKRADEILKRVFEFSNQEQIKFLIDRIKMEDSATDDTKIRYIWHSLLLVAERSENKILRKTIFETIYLSELFIDFSEDDLKLFKRTLQLVSSDINSYRLLKTIEQKLNGNTNALAGKLLEILIKNASDEVFFDEEKLMSIVESLYQTGQKELADNIAIASVEKRNFRLVHIYNKFHAS